MERTLILVKPDAFARSLTGEIIARFERKGLRIVALRHMTVTRELAEQHYAEHAERPFFGELVDFITSAPIVAMVLEGEEAVKAARQVIGATNPLEAASGSIRGDFAIQTGQNMVHGSDSAESGARETALFFGELAS
jgi:nucleoside-diphosphate kinase